MQSSPFSRRFSITQWVIAASYSLVFSFWIFFHKNTGISISRLLITAVPFSVFLIAAYSIRQSLTKSTSTLSNNIIDRIVSRPSGMILTQFCAVTGISMGLLGIFLPVYFFGSHFEYYIRIQPLMIWAGIFGLQLLILTLSPRRTEIYKQLHRSLIENRNTLRLSLWIFLAFILIWIFIAVTKMGISGSADYWYEAGVPILPAQIIISLLAGLLFGKVENSLRSVGGLKLDRWVFFGIWAITAVFWGITPPAHSYFNPMPMPPNHETYPYSDAAKYDLQSQYALIGQGLDNGSTMDNPAYPAFLVLIHLISGQNYDVNMALQAAIYAIFPAIAYLLGKTLIGRAMGITAALLIAFRGYNSIVTASLINLGNPKLMMLDFPTAIGVALSIFTLITWLGKKRDDDPAAAIWHGGVTGFAFLIRPTALVLLAIAPFITLIQRFPYGKWIRLAILTLLGFVIFITPWGIRNEMLGSSAIKSYLNKINFVRKERFPELKEDKPVKPSDNSSEQTQNKDNTPDNSQAEQLSYGAIIKIISSHFFNNLIGSTLILPTSPMFDDLYHTIKSPDTIWKPFWDGNLTFGQILTLLVSLGILAVGFAAAWKKNQSVGLAPLMAFLLYQFANSVGRTSGGRYIVPVDWIIVFYFAIGLIEICRVIFQSPTIETINPITTTKSFSKSMIVAASLVLILGAIPLLTEIPILTRSTLEDKETEPAYSNFQEILSQSNYSEEDISNFLKEKSSILVTGQALYPKYFNYHAASRYIEKGLGSIEFPHIEFTLAGPQKVKIIILYKESLVELANNANVLVLGCQQENLYYVDAIAIIVRAPVKTAHIRQSNPPLKCPLRQPVCDNNGNCN